MNWIRLAQPSVSRLCFPSDLRVWLGEDHLLRLALEAAAQGPPSPASTREFRHGRDTYPVSQLLALSVFAHLSGRFGSETIAEELDQDPAFRYLCAGRFPSASALRRFRRQHRALLGAALHRVLARAAAARQAQGWTGRSTPAPPSAGQAEALAAAAEACLTRATLADTMAMDV